MNGSPAPSPIDATRSDQRGRPGVHRLPLIAGCAALLGAAAIAAPAQARDLFTLDKRAGSGGPIVVDAAGNGYVAWSTKAANVNLPDQTMFCRIPAGGTCTDPIALPLPSTAAGDEDGTQQPFTAITAGGLVYVVAPRYVMDDTIIWLSTDGGASFGAPTEIPMGSYAGEIDADDVLLEPNEPSLGASPPVAYFDIASDDPGLGYSFVPTNEVSGTTSFQFAAPGAGGVGGNGATLGEQPDGLPLVAYWEADPIERIDYYWAMPGVAIGTPQAFSGPVTLGDGYLPKLASGPKGLFLVSEDYKSPNARLTPSVLQVRAFDASTDQFGAPVTLVSDSQDAVGLGGDAGAVDENATTGEIAVAWPDLAHGTATVRLWTSSDGGASFTAHGAIARLGDDFTDLRVAVNAAGGGLLTWQNHAGLQVADLVALPVKHPADKKH